MGCGASKPEPCVNGEAEPSKAEAKKAAPPSAKKGAAQPGPEMNNRDAMVVILKAAGFNVSVEGGIIKASR